jgi:alpha-1,2-mannosyltransferase
MTSSLQRVAVALLIGASVTRTVYALAQTPLDFLVYRQAGLDVSDGLSPYRDTGGLPFTYPPLAAYLASPFAWLPEQVGSSLFACANLAAYTLVVTLVARRLGMPRAHLLRWLAGGLTLAPVERHLALGQVNLLLMGLVAVDLLVMPHRATGVLIGLAAAIKVVPGVFVIVLLLRGERASAVRAIGTAAALTGLALLADPAASSRYFASLLWDPTRVGGVTYPDNQSVVGVVARAMATNTPPAWVTLPVEVLVLTLGVLAARRSLASKDEVGALVCLAIGALLASPVSWSHHWVWIVPAAMWLSRQGHARLAALLLATSAIGPVTLTEWLDPGARLAVPWPWPPLAQLSCALMPLVAVIVLLAQLRGHTAERRRAAYSPISCGEP